MKLSKVKFSKLAGGRVGVYAPWYPGANNRGYVLRSRLVMSSHVGRELSPSEFVHHENEDPQDDRIENLDLETRSSHTQRHWEDGTFDGNRKHDPAPVLELRAQGLGYKKISKLLGIPRDSVRYICNKGGGQGIDRLTEN